MNKIKKMITDLYNSLNSKEKLILVIILIIIMSFIYFTFIKNSYKKNDIDYRKISIESMKDSAEVVYDRNLIMGIDECINNILKVNDGAFKLNNKTVTIKNIYDEVVSDNYKKSVSYNKFKKKIENVYKNVLGNEGYIDGKKYIKNVLYSSNNNIYLVEIGDDSYIGIVIDDFSYTIGYVE